MRGAVMIFAGLILCASAGAAAPQAAEPDERADSAAFLEVEAEKDAYFVQEPIRIRLCVGFDEEFFESRAIQLFRQRLDVPIQVQADWLDELPGTAPLSGETEAAEGAVHEGERGRRRTWSLALNDDAVEAVRAEDRVIGGRTFAVLWIERSFLPLRPGAIEIPEARLRFAYASRFQESLVGGRMAEDRREVLVTGPSPALRVRPLPEEGRPPEFKGAVGRLTVQARAEPRELELGESLRLTLRIEGEGNLEFFDPPVLDGIEGFHVYGSIDDKGRERRLVTYDLAPLRAGVKEVPPIAFAYFDTGEPPGYRVIRTEAVSVVVHAAPDDGALAPLPEDEGGRPQPGRNDLYGLKSVSARGRGGGALRLPPAAVVGGLVAPWLMALALLLWTRARERDRRDPDGVRARRAAGVFRRRIAGPGGDQTDALAEYLAARLRCPPGAVIDPDLHRRLEEAGVPAPAAQKAAALLRRMVAARYGSGSAEDHGGELRALVEELEGFFQQRKERAP